MSSINAHGGGNVGERLAEAALESRLLQEVTSMVMNERVERAALASELTRLHNSRRADIVHEFRGLNNDGSSEFFMVRQVFEETLPSLDAAVGEVMETVVHLCRQGGHDLAAGTIVSPFMEFCDNDIQRSRDAVALLAMRPDDFGELLVAIVMVGARSEPNTFFEHAERLSLDGEVAGRQRAVMALGRLASTAMVEPQRALAAVETALRANNGDEMCAAAIKACGPVVARGGVEREYGTHLLRTALEQGGDHTLHAGAELLWLHGVQLPREVVTPIFDGLRNVSPEHTGTIGRIDLAISGLLGTELRPQALSLLSSLLESAKVSIADLGSTMIALSRDAGLSALATEWFASGRRELCQAIGEIVQHHHQDTTRLRFDDAHLVAAGETADRYFIGKRAVGFLFAKPKATIAFLCSLMTGVDSDVDTAIRHLILDPMLINYPGSGREALESCREGASEELQRSIDGLIQSLQEYLEMLGGGQRLKALEVPEADREAYRRYMTVTMEESMREAEKKSAILSLVHRSTILYGRSSINYVLQADGSSRRMEVPMSTHGVSVEFPRMSNIDPVGLSFRLRVLRNEPRA